MEVTSTYENATFEEVLDDLCVRFIFNLPEEEMTSRERVCFQIEEAHWFYEDFVREQNPKFHGLNLRQFVGEIFKHCPLLQKWGMSEDAYTEFMTYKKRVPIRGAILLNEALTHCILVKGWKQSASWSFPRGKINKDEEDDLCAVREVLEETGYNMSKLIDPTQFILHESLGNNHMKLYIVPGVPEDTVFIPLSRKEISRVEWVELEELPLFSKKKPANIGTFSMGKLFMVTPFMPALRKWIHRQRKHQRSKTKPQNQIRHLEIDGETEPETSAVELSPPRELSPPNPDRPNSSSNVGLLKNLLGVKGTQTSEVIDPPGKGKEASSMKLMSILKAGESQPLQTPNPMIKSPTASGLDLLAILRGGTPSQSSTPPATKQHTKPVFNPINPVGAIIHEQTSGSAPPNHIQYFTNNKPNANKLQTPPLRTIMQNQLNKPHTTSHVNRQQHNVKTSAPTISILKRPSNPESQPPVAQLLPQFHAPSSQSAKLLQILKAPAVQAAAPDTAYQNKSAESEPQSKVMKNDRRASLTSHTFVPPQGGHISNQMASNLNGNSAQAKALNQNDSHAALSLSSEEHLPKFSKVSSKQMPTMNDNSNQQTTPAVPKENALPIVESKEKQEHLASLLQTLKSTKAIVPNPASLSLSPDSTVGQYQIKSPGPNSATLYSPEPIQVPILSSSNFTKAQPIIVPPPQILTPNLSPTFDRRQVVKSEDAQQLLGLFRQVSGTNGAPSVVAAPTSPAMKTTALKNLPQPSFIQSTMPTPAVQPPAARKRSSLSPDKNSFLLGYLDEIAKKYGH